MNKLPIEKGGPGSGPRKTLTMDKITGPGKIKAYHSTSSAALRGIKKKGFNIDPNNERRKKLFGTGIYTSITPKDRYGDNILEVEIDTKKPLIDLDGGFTYGDTDLGKEIWRYGETIFPGYIEMKEKDNRELDQKVIDSYAKKYGYDSFITQEFGELITVALDPEIIKFDKLYKENK